MVAAGPHRCGVAGDLHARPGQEVVDPGVGMNSPALTILLPNGGLTKEFLWVDWRRRELAKAPRAVAEASFDAATSSAEATGTKTAVLQGPKKGCSGCSGPTRIFNISV